MEHANRPRGAALSTHADTRSPSSAQVRFRGIRAARRAIRLRRRFQKDYSAADQTCADAFVRLRIKNHHFGGRLGAAQHDTMVNERGHLGPLRSRRKQNRLHFPGKETQTTGEKNGTKTINCSHLGVRCRAHHQRRARRWRASDGCRKACGSATAVRRERLAQLIAPAGARDRLTSLSAVSSIVHDLRNPLATIHGGAEMLVRSRLSQPQIDRIARNLYGASVRMRELLEEFLDRSRSAVTVESSDLCELVGCAVAKIVVSAEFQSVQIVQTVPKGLKVPMDRSRILRVLVNLLVNALEVMPTGGTISLSAEADSRFVTVRVLDTGPGIAPEIQSRLFQPFASWGKPNGIGLGLALSRQTVVEHGGDMWDESSIRGACFAFSLPRSIPQSPAFSC
jgi:signal transduction histidine kinase